MTGVPNDAPHAHADVGNVVVKQGEQDVLADLGQRTYGFTGRTGVALGDQGAQHDRGARRRTAGSGSSTPARVRSRPTGTTC